ncbi:hypothetical protein ACIRVK_28800 [Streptomyces sp. NPDC101152]|uniref:hypothetical protein n=1 Tax=Streptomyces sp. NPDC101152 TaxID=3366116 RepID=UPI003829BFFF
MNYFPEPEHAAEAADEDRSTMIAQWLTVNENGPRDAFWWLLDDALNAEDWAKLHGQYPPAGHGYPREDHA